MKIKFQNLIFFKLNTFKGSTIGWTTSDDASIDSTANFSTDSTFFKNAIHVNHDGNVAVQSGSFAWSWQFIVAFDFTCTNYFEPHWSLCNGSTSIGYVLVGPKLQRRIKKTLYSRAVKEPWFHDGSTFHHDSLDPGITAATAIRKKPQGLFHR